MLIIITPSAPGRKHHSHARVRRSETTSHTVNQNRGTAVKRIASRFDTAHVTRAGWRTRCPHRPRCSARELFGTTTRRAAATWGGGAEAGQQREAGRDQNCRRVLTRCRCLGRRASSVSTSRATASRCPASATALVTGGCVGRDRPPRRQYTATAGSPRRRRPTAD